MNEFCREGLDLLRLSCVFFVGNMFKISYAIFFYNIMIAGCNELKSLAGPLINTLAAS